MNLAKSIRVSINAVLIVILTFSTLTISKAISNQGRIPDGLE
jgi:hypothetical protein